MNINNFLIIQTCIFSLLFSYNQNTNNSLLLALDPFDLSNFVLNKYHPNQNIDLTYYSIILDGSSNFPLYQSIPSDISFNRNEKGTLSELKYKERKADKYFDTGISLKKDINDETNLLLQVESKSIVENINQNVFFDYKKTTDNLILELSYLYHYEDDPDIYSLVVNNDSSKENESFNYGLNVNYSKNKLSFNNHFAFQTSYINRPLVLEDLNTTTIQYYHQTIWHNSNINYQVSPSFKIYFDNNYKKNLLENYDNHELFLNKNFNKSSLGFSYEIEDVLSFLIGLDHYNNLNKPHMQLSYNRKNIRAEFSINNFIIDQIKHNDQTNSIDLYVLDFTSRYKTSIIFDYRIIKSNFELGEIINNNYHYNYFMSDGFIDIWKLVFDYNYYNYFNQSKGSLSINSYLNYGISFYPFKNKYKFEMYGSINYYQYEFNSSIDLLTWDLFDNFDITVNNVKLYNFSIGFIFDS